MLLSLVKLKYFNKIAVNTTNEYFIELQKQLQISFNSLHNKNLKNYYVAVHFLFMLLLC